MRVLGGRRTSSFWGKAALAAGLIGAADVALFGPAPGAAVGVAALLWTGATAATGGRIGRGRGALFALAAVLAVALFDRPTVIGAACFWVALTSAALLSRGAAAVDAWAWTRRLAAHAARSLQGPTQDFARLKRLSGGQRVTLRGVVSTAVLPLGGGAVFLALFASANPIVAGLLSRVRVPAPNLVVLARALFWSAALVAVWATLRPFRRRVARRRPSPPAWSSVTPSVYLAPTPVILALALFNALFAVENGLDLAFLWSGAGLPSGMTLAGYAHRGAYPLVATALLAGAFSLIFLQERSETARRPLVRGLVGLWLAQNVFLVASSILRTVDYVEVYSLTRFRIAALLWMGMVGIGLALTGWRLLRRKSAAWLVNTNAAVLAGVLLLCSAVDLGEVAAAWNVSHAAELGGRAAVLDACYLAELGPSALGPLGAFGRRPVPPDDRARAEWVRYRTVMELRRKQQDWRSWTWRGARRLQAADGRRPDGPEWSCADRVPFAASAKTALTAKAVQ